MTIRAKFRCTEKTSFHNYTGQKVIFTAEYDPDLIKEDVSFAKYTPKGNLEILVDNPNAVFELGQDYYLDFTPVGED